MKAKDERIIKRTIDPASLPVLSAEQQEMLEKLAAKPEAEIDYSDAPPSLPETEWYRAAANPMYRPTKQTTTVRLDADVLAWLKSKGRGYQTRLNAILRESMLQELERQARK
ncbi:MAG: hypothetical protein BWK73_16975 [Thiothrix lacustris]|uniref:Cytoplasmic protein n=1 Tax=Thiothrix lacustris TaxID=525917 RepID=A0A1Y1QRG8_9GAMM|nr:MAG: hypothetical protein BWK73_16975 [Thiothrix lacustris]